MPLAVEGGSGGVLVEAVEGEVVVGHVQGVVLGEPGQSHAVEEAIPQRLLFAG